MTHMAAREIDLTPVEIRFTIPRFHTQPPDGADVISIKVGTSVFDNFRDAAKKSMNTGNEIEVVAERYVPFDGSYLFHVVYDREREEWGPWKPC